MRAMTHARAACAALAGMAWATGPLVAQKGVSLLSTVPSVLWHATGEGRGRPAVDGTAAYFLSKNHEVLAFDADDSVKARQMGHLLEWDREGDDLQKLFATYTLVRRPALK